MLLWWKGKIKLNLPTRNLIPGQTVEGNFSLDLKKPQKAKGLYVTFYGEERRREYT